jgi:hypothetical protein
MPGAFTKMLRDANGPWPVLAGHDLGEQIELGDLEDSRAGLLLKGKLILETEKARQSYGLMKAKALRVPEILNCDFATTIRFKEDRLRRAGFQQSRCDPRPTKGQLPCAWGR